MKHPDDIHPDDWRPGPAPVDPQLLVCARYGTAHQRLEMTRLRGGQWMCCCLDCLEVDNEGYVVGGDDGIGETQQDALDSYWENACEPGAADRGKTRGGPVKCTVSRWLAREQRWADVEATVMVPVAKEEAS